MWTQQIRPSRGLREYCFLQELSTTKDTKAHQGISLCTFMSFVVHNLRQSLHHTRKRLGQIVINHHYREQYQEDERRLINPLLDVQADIAAHQALHEQQQNDTAVEDGNGQQVKDAEVQTDRSR